MFAFVEQLNGPIESANLPGRPVKVKPIKSLSKGVGDPNRFTVSLMSFFRGLHLKSLFFCKLLQDISKRWFVL
jgi:hypothetical protein